MNVRKERLTMQVENFGFKKFSLTIQILATMQVCTDAETSSA